MQFADDQTASRVILNNGVVLTKCDQCRQMYAERTPPSSPPCESCWVDLDTKNEEAAQIYQIVRGQIITRSEDVVDLNHLAVWAAIDAYGIRNRVGTFEKVLRLFHSLLRDQKNEGRKL